MRDLGALAEAVNRYIFNLRAQLDFAERANEIRVKTEARSVELADATLTAQNELLELGATAEELEKLVSDWQAHRATDKLNYGITTITS